MSNLMSVGVHPIVWALLTADRTEVSYRVVVGLLLIALAWIAAGLWLIRIGERGKSVRR